MHVYMSPCVHMLVLMDCAIGMRVPVCVRSSPGGKSEAPDKVGQAEGHEGPGCKIAPGGFEGLQASDRKTESNSKTAEYDRSQNMSESAQGGDYHRLAERPLART